MDDDASMLGVSFERPEEIRESMVPLLIETAEKVKKQFVDSRASIALINAVKTQTYRDSDSHKVNVEFESAVTGFDSLSADQMRYTLQSYADKTSSALRDSAMNLERVLSLQAKLTASETANKRLSSVLDSLEPFLLAKLEEVAEREGNRISLVRETREYNSQLNVEKKTLSKRLNETSKQLTEANATVRQFEDTTRDLGLQLEEAVHRADCAMTDLENTRRKLSDALQREENLRRSVQEVHDSKRQETGSLVRERNDAQSTAEQLQHEIRRMTDEHAKQMRDKERDHKRKEKEVIDTCTEQLKKCQSYAATSIKDAYKETKLFAEERDKYYKLYKELLDDLGKHKEQNLAMMQAKILDYHRKLFSEMNVEKARTMRAMRTAIPELPSPQIGPTYLADLQSSSADDSGSQASVLKENNHPIAATQHVTKAARSYSVQGRMPNTRGRPIGKR